MEEYNLREFISKTVEWKIPNFFDRPMLFDYSLNSPNFSLPDGGEKVFFRINSSHFANSVILGLIKETPPLKHSTLFRIWIKKADGMVFKAIERMVDPSKIDPAIAPSMIDPAIVPSMIDPAIVPCAYLFMTLKRSEMLSGDVAAPDGSLTVFCTATIRPEPLVPSPLAAASSSSVTGTLIAASQAPSSITTEETAAQTTSSDGNSILLERFKNIYISRHTDVTILVKNEEYRAHKSVLAHGSSKFSSMFEHEMAENISGKVEISDCDPSCFEEFLLFLYTGELDNVSSSKAVDLYKTAGEYDVEQLKYKCHEIMTRDE